jgi:hypothetical protein
MTPLEQKGMREILTRLGLLVDQVDRALNELRVQRREWSQDVSDPDRCVGRFIYFVEGDPLPLVDRPTHLGVTASHPDMPGGADFLLFLRAAVPTVLEVGFFGFPMSKAVFEGDISCFQF